jgi:hypothetical protein
MEIGGPQPPIALVDGGEVLPRFEPPQWIGKRLGTASFTSVKKPRLRGMPLRALTPSSLARRCVGCPTSATQGRPATGPTPVIP